MTKKVTTDVWTGGCPECGSTDGYVKAGTNRWGFCTNHQTKWLIRADLFSTDPGEGVAEAYGEVIDGYREVEPILPTVSLCPRCETQTIGGKLMLSHSVLCLNPDGSKTELSDKAVLTALTILRRQDHQITRAIGQGLDDDIPF